MSGLLVERHCKGCSKTFFAKAIKIRQGGGKFCSVECYKDFRQANASDQKYRNRIHQKKHKYGLTEDEYLALFVKQNNRCAICSISFEKVSAHVDHCHETKKVRGLLCSKCNTILGMSNDNIIILNNAVKYLNRA